MKNDPSYDIYILDGIKSTNQNIHILFSLIENAKSSIPFDSALYIPNIATPLNVSLFVYLGVDIFDTTKIKYCSLNDIYFVNNGFFNVMELKSIPCNCNICKTISLKDLTLMSQQKKFNFLYLHNLNVLKSEISIIKEKIIRNDLRNYVESKCKTDTYLSGILRLYDQSRYYTNSTAIYKNGQLISTSSESLLRSDVKTFYSRIHERYKKPKKDILLILPCSSKKPYSLSKSHRKIMNTIGENKRYIHEIILTSPLGIVPRELEIIYPSSFYDTTVTGYWDNNEIEFLKLMLRKYLTKNKYKYIVAHVSIEYQKICKEIEKESDIKIIYTSTEESNILSENNLNNLNNTIRSIISKDKNINKLTSFSDKINLFRAIIYYQFGFIPETIFINPKVKNRYQKYELYSNNVLMAIISYDSKLMTFSLEGVKKIMMDNQYKGQYTVYVENFKPKGSILSPGIISSNIQIKPNDTVFIKGKDLFGIGKAFMSGYEMCNSQKGEAISIKNIKIEDN